MPRRSQPSKDGIPTKSERDAFDAAFRLWYLKRYGKEYGKDYGYNDIEDIRQCKADGEEECGDETP